MVDKHLALVAQTIRLAALLLVVVFAAMIAQLIWAYLKTPEIVSQLERSTPFPLGPAQVSEVRREWLLAVDDPTFYQHNGVDSRTPGAGYTTITQGIVKVLFFEHFEPGLFRWRKIKQTVTAVAINARVSKEEQLRLFLNIVDLGTQEDHDVRGFSEGAKAYFAKPFAELTDEQYLQLVAVIVAPAKYSLTLHPDQNRERVRRIKRLLAKECEPESVADVEYIACAN